MRWNAGVDGPSSRVDVITQRSDLRKLMDVHK